MTQSTTSPRTAEARFTKGPWSFIVDPDGKYGITGFDHKFLAITDTKANARMIAASPTMAEFIARIAEHFADTDAPLGIEARAILRQALGD